MVKWAKNFLKKTEVKKATSKKVLIFEEELIKLKKQVQNFFITQTKNRGVIVKEKNYTLKKKGEKFFHLEGKEENGKNYSIYISVGSFLSQNSEKILGVLNLDELDLNGAISNNHLSLSSFLDEMKNLDLDQKSFSILNSEKRKLLKWEFILEWDAIWKEKLLAELNPNLTALMCIFLENFDTFFQENCSSRQKEMVTDELCYLSMGKSNQEFSPNSKNYNLFEFQSAQQQFLTLLYKIQKKIDTNL